MSSNTICVSQEGPANALALNRDCTQVVIAGRNVFKVFSIDNDEFSEICNLRVGKNLNLNFSSIDVAWSTIEENTLATAATNGAVVVWNLGRSGRSKQEHVFSDHKRTVNKVSFHLTDPALLISGSQDGMMKCFDLRMKEVVRTFLSNTESVRDVQFSPHSAHTFAAVSENGNVQLWDARRAERCFHQFTAHSGPVFACDWHPEVPWLATASRDKTIKVWDIHGKPSLEHTIYTIASVGHVKWRPQKKYHIASCALVLDSSVNIWDVRRPHVPFATFAEHRDVTTAIAWKADPDVFLSTSRDCTLYRHTFRDALHPVMSANPHGVSISPRGELALASSKHRNPAIGAPSLADRIQGFIGRKQHNWSAGWQQQLEAAFPGAGASALTRWPGDSGAALAGCARRYRLRGAPLHELCAHNASVARDYGRDMVSHVWLVVGVLYQFRAPSARPDWDPAANAAPTEDGGTGGGGGELAAPDASGVGGEHGRVVRGEVYNSYGVDDEPEAEEWSENQFHNSGVLGMPTQSIYIPPIYNRHDSSRDEDKFWLTAASAHYVDLEAADWALPEEAFPLRSAAPDAHSNNGSGLAEDASSEGASGDLHGSSTTNPAAAGQPTNSSQPGTAVAPHSPGSASSNQSQGPPLSLPAQGGGKVVRTNSVVSQHSATSALTTVEDQPIGELRVWEQPTTPAWDGTQLLADALKLHAELGDVQTSVTVMLVLGENRNDLFPYIDEATQEHWLLGYLELLARHKLWNVSTEIIQCAWVASVWQLSQQSTTVHLSCGPCGRHLARPGHAPCERCASSPSVCAVCHEVVRGLYAWCQGCAHGGHVQHMQKWFAKYKQCPTGCGHHCEYS